MAKMSKAEKQAAMGDKMRSDNADPAQVEGVAAMEAVANGDTPEKQAARDAKAAEIQARKDAAAARVEEAKVKAEQAKADKEAAKLAKAKEAQEAKEAKRLEAEARKAEREAKAAEGGAMVIDRARYAYARSGSKTSTGRPAVDNGDPIAVALRGKDGEDVIRILVENGGEVNPKWSTLNVGMQRMNAANVLRRLARESADGVEIDGVRIKMPPLKQAA